MHVNAEALINNYTQLLRYCRACGSYQDFLEEEGGNHNPYRRTDNTMAKRTRTKEQTTIYKG
jgi:hypothetical protein